MKYPTLVSTLLLATLTARADVVADWNNAALTSIRAARTSPPQASRQLAILHTAIYDAVNGIKAPHELRYQPYRTAHPGPPMGDQVAAASASARRVLVKAWPADQARFDTLYNAIIATRRPGKNLRDGIAYGEKVADIILADRAQDGSTNAVPYTVPPTPGIWRPTISFGGVVRGALLPHWGSVKPFGIPTGARFRPPAPPALPTDAYADEVNEVKALGQTNSTTRTAEQTEIAYFWANGAGTATPPGHWNLIAQTIAEDQDLSLDESARLFALLNIAMADAAIASWDCKYAYNLWRPITAIQEADSAGNTNIVQDALWQPLLFTPPFPEYVSGHSTFSAAAATVIGGFFGTDDISFTARSEERPEIVRSYERLSDAALESGMSRIYGGIHFMSGNVYGLDLGASIGEEVIRHLLTAHKPRGRR